MKTFGPLSRSCGECTACCKTMGVADHPRGKKPVNHWCQDCTIGKGCNIYASRPKSCVDFECCWLQDERGIMDDSMRPDRLKVIFQPVKDGHGLVAHCDPSMPMAWRKGKAFQMLRKAAEAGYHASARAGNRYWVITPTTEWVVPDDCLVDDGTGELQVRIPHEVAIRIGLRASPEKMRRAGGVL